LLVYLAQKSFAASALPYPVAGISLKTVILKHMKLLNSFAIFL